MSLLPPGYREGRGRFWGGQVGGNLRYHIFLLIMLEISHNKKNLQGRDRKKWFPTQLQWAGRPFYISGLVRSRGAAWAGGPAAAEAGEGRLPKEPVTHAYTGCLHGAPTPSSGTLSQKGGRFAMRKGEAERAPRSVQRHSCARRPLLSSQQRAAVRATTDSRAAQPGGRGQPARELKAGNAGEGRTGEGLEAGLGPARGGRGLARTGASPAVQ